MASASKSKTLDIAASTSASSKYTLSVSFNQSSKDVVNNQSTISITGKISNKNFSFSGTKCMLKIYWYDNNTRTGGVKIGEIEVSSMSANTSKSITKTVTVPHKSDGTLSGYARVRWERSSANSYCPATADFNTANTTLDTIPREGKLSGLYQDNWGTYCTRAFGFNITKQSTALYHELVVTNNATNYSQTFVDSVLANGFNSVRFDNANGTSSNGALYYKQDFNTLNKAIPNGKSITFTLTLNTYNNSSKSSLIGTSSASATYTITGTDISFGSSIEVTDSLTKTLTGANNKFINGVSTIKATINNVNIKSGANASSYYFKYYNEEKTQSGSNYTFGLKATTNSNTLSLRVNDSRGFSSNISTPSISLINYFKPNVQIATDRLDATSTSAKVKINGTFWNGNFGAAQNKLTLHIGYKRTSDSDYTTTTITPTINGNNYSYEFQIDNIPTNEEVDIWVDPEDKIIRVINNHAQISKAIAVIDIGDDFVGVNGDVEVSDGSLYVYNPGLYSTVRGRRKIDGKNWDIVLGVGATKAGRMEFVNENNTVLGGVEANQDGNIYNSVNRNQLSENEVYIKQHNNQKWQKLGNLKFKQHTQGEFAYFKILISNGNNGATTQNACVDLYMQLGWVGDNGGRAGCNAILTPLGTGMNVNSFDIIVIANSNINYDIWFKSSYTYCRPNIIPFCSKFATFTSSGETTSDSTPSGTQCLIAKHTY